MAKHGQQMGCRDGSRVVFTGEDRLSRMHDMLMMAEEAGTTAQEVFRLFPQEAKLEYNYSCWYYREQRPATGFIGD